MKLGQGILSIAFIWFWIWIGASAGEGWIKAALVATLGFAAVSFIMDMFIKPKKDATPRKEHDA